MGKPIAILSTNFLRGMSRAIEGFPDENKYGYSFARAVVYLKQTGQTVAFVVVRKEQLRGLEISGFWVEGPVSDEMVRIAETRVR